MTLFQPPCINCGKPIEWGFVDYSDNEDWVHAYKIIRFCADDEDSRHRSVIKRGLTLKQAQAHCHDKTTHGEGWFDGYEQENA